MSPHVDMTTRLAGIVLPNPVIAASGTYGHGDEVARQGNPARVGAITVKSLSADPWPGNAAPRVHETPAGMLNSVGLQNPGVDAWRDAELPRLRALGARVVASVWGRTIEDFARAAKLVAEADAELIAIEVNASCPNIEDRSHMFAHSIEGTKAAVGAVVGHAGALPVFAKLSPNVTDLVSIAGAALEAGASGLTLINTVMGMAIDSDRRRFRLGAGGGGLSGPAIRPVAVRAVFEVSRAYPNVAIIGTGGVARAEDAVEMLLAGASAVGVGTATFRDVRAPERIAQGLERWCRRRGVAAVSELVGALETGAT